MIYATCHPDRRHVGRRLCGKCYYRTYWNKRDLRRRRSKNLMGLLRLGEALTRVIPALAVLPAACPHCLNGCLRHYTGAPEVNCPVCGWEAVLAEGAR